MGFNVVALAQKPRTRTLIVDSDLDMGNYDLIATDVKGDTAEFTEFVGGVGNFESGLVSGGFDVSGILHAESNLQVDGGISLEGSINNVNITPEGDISALSLTTNKLNLPIGTTGNFNIGVVSMPTLSYYPGEVVINGNSPVTYNLGVPTLQSTIPKTLSNEIPDVGLNVSLYSPQANVGTSTSVYQGDTLIHSYSYGNASFNLKNYSENVRVVVTLSERGTYNQARKSIELTKTPTTFYLQ